ncbi:hydrogenase, partial [Dickeya dadantii]|nr:hydrogenase [Dickeya dadantii]
MSMLPNGVDHYHTTPITLDEQAQQLKKTLLKDIQRSAYVYRVDCGGCNG